MLNLPQFEERPPARVHGDPAQVPGGPGAGTPVSGQNVSQAGDSDTAVVSNLQFNSPLAMYSGENVVEALQGQTGGHISSVVGYVMTTNHRRH